MLTELPPPVRALSPQAASPELILNDVMARVLAGEVKALHVTMIENGGDISHIYSHMTRSDLMAIMCVSEALLKRILFPI